MGTSPRAKPHSHVKWQQFNALADKLDAMELLAAIPYKKYKAVLSQSGTGAPIATVLENTIGVITWTRYSAGIYNGNATGCFGDLGDNQSIWFNPTTTTNKYTEVSISKTDSDTIVVNTKTLSGGAFAAADDVLLNTSIEVYVYKTPVMLSAEVDNLGEFLTLVFSTDMDPTVVPFNFSIEKGQFACPIDSVVVDGRSIRLYRIFEFEESYRLSYSEVAPIYSSDGYPLITFNDYTITNECVQELTMTDADTSVAGTLVAFYFSTELDVETVGTEFTIYVNGVVNPIVSGSVETEGLELWVVPTNTILAGQTITVSYDQTIAPVYAANGRILHTIEARSVTNRAT